MQARSWKGRAWQAARRTAGTCTAVFGRVARLPHARLLGLRSVALRAFDRGDYSGATTLATELLTLAERYRGDWFYGNAVHHGHLILGRVALASGNAAMARRELLAAGRTPGSPQLDSWGPNMELALEMIRTGEHEAVLEYFELCRAFWGMGHARLDAWASLVADRREPEFGGNLFY